MNNLNVLSLEYYFFNYSLYSILYSLLGIGLLGLMFIFQQLIIVSLSPFCFLIDWIGISMNINFFYILGGLGLLINGRFKWMIFLFVFIDNIDLSLLILLNK